MKNRKNSYSIRKLSVGASSIVVASMLFIGGSSAYAAESNHQGTQDNSEVSTSQSIGEQQNNQTDKQSETDDTQNNTLETKDNTSTIHNTDDQQQVTPKTDATSNDENQVDSKSNESQASTTEKDQRNDNQNKAVQEPTSQDNNAQEEESSQTTHQEDANSLDQPQKDEKTTSEQPQTNKSSLRTTTMNQDQTHVKDLTNTQKEDKTTEQPQTSKDIKTHQKDTQNDKEETQKVAEVTHRSDKNATQSSEDVTSEQSTEQHVTAEDTDATQDSPVKGFNKEEQATISDKDLNVNQLDEGNQTKESHKNDNNDSKKGINALTENAQATTRNNTTVKASKEAKDQTNKVAPQAQYKNHDPIILVHGFNGYASGTGPLIGKANYWGGDRLNIIKEARAKGYNVMEASVGAFGSNYDRAVELYYYIKGGTVDYGAAHAAKYGHERYGKTYAGAYKDWIPGQKIHLIGHSMGGQTIRYLEELLRHGSPEEVEYQKEHGGDISPLYKGGQDNMISSITTIATPHNGTHAADLFGNEALVRQIAYDYARAKGNKLSHVDVGLRQWGLKQRDDETLAQYIHRVKQSKLWKTKDNGFYDLTTEGTNILNHNTSLNPNIVYKTYQGESTRPAIDGTQKADINMNIGYTLTADAIGKLDDTAWRENDGLVSVISGQHPFNQAYTPATDQIQKGIWQVTPVKHNWDHGDFVGTDTSEVRISKKDLEEFWDNMFEDMVRNEQVTDK